MVDKAHLQDKQVIFRTARSIGLNVGTVRLVENDGFWIESEQLFGQLTTEPEWATVVPQLQTPVFFFPTSSLAFLIAKRE